MMDVKTWGSKYQFFLWFTTSWMLFESSPASSKDWSSDFCHREIPNQICEYIRLLLCSHGSEHGTSQLWHNCHLVKLITKRGFATWRKGPPDISSCVLWSCFHCAEYCFLSCSNRYLKKFQKIISSIFWSREERVG